MKVDEERSNIALGLRRPQRARTTLARPSVNVEYGEWKTQWVFLPVTCT
jgi:hypothetical protein